MAFARGDGTWMRYIAEATPGTTPTSGTMIGVADITETLKYNRSKTPSQSLISHGQVESLIRQSSSVTNSSTHEMRYGEFDWAFESALRGTFTANVLIIGTTVKTFSIERGFPVVTTPHYQLFRGLECDGFAMSVPSDTRKVDLTFNWFGRDEVTPVPTTDWVAANVGVTLGANPAEGKSPMYLQCGELKVDGTPLATVTSLSLTTSKGLGPIDVVDCDAPIDVVSSQLLTINGDMSYVFDDASLHNDFLQDVGFTLDLTFTDGTSTYLIEMDACEFSDSERPVTGPTQVTNNASFVSKYDSTMTSSIRMTRTA